MLPKVLCQRSFFSVADESGVGEVLGGDLRMGLFAPLGQETVAHGAYDINDAHLGLIGIHAGVGLGLVSVE